MKIKIPGGREIFGKLGKAKSREPRAPKETQKTSLEQKWAGVGTRLAAKLKVRGSQPRSKKGL